MGSISGIVDVIEEGINGYSFNPEDHKKLGELIMKILGDEKLKKRYKRAIVPVKEDNTCLGCFIKLPTSLSSIGRTDQEVIYCEGCGRILYWLT